MPMPISLFRRLSSLKLLNVSLDPELQRWVQARANLLFEAAKPFVETSLEHAGTRELELAQEPQAIRELGPVVLNFARIADRDRAPVDGEDFQMLATEYNWINVGHLRAVRAVKRG